MNQDFNLWKHQVQGAIANLCNIEFEAAGGDGASFREALCSLYSEGQFLEFLSFQGWRQAGLSDEVGQELENLRQQLDEYDEPDSDAAIQADPCWWALTAQARKVAALMA